MRYQKKSCNRFSRHFAKLLFLSFCLFYLVSCSQFPPAQNTQAASAKAYLRLAQSYYAQHEPELARKAFSKVLVYDDQNSAAWQGLALLAQQNHQYAQANKNYRKSLMYADEKNRAEILNNWATLYYSEGQIEKACQTLEAAQESAHLEQRVRILVNLSQCQLKLNQVDFAKQTLTLAEKFDAQNSVVLLAQAYLHYNQHEYQKAQLYLLRYQNIAKATPASQQLSHALANKAFAQSLGD